MKIDLNLQKIANYFIFRLLLMLSMSQGLFNSYKSIIVKLVSNKNLHNYYQLLK